jgi:hypothetical protein
MIFGDMKLKILKKFSDFEILILEKDVEPGILLKAKKPLDWKPNSLEAISLYSMVEGKRVLYVPGELTITRKFLITAKMYYDNLLISRAVRKLRRRIKRLG